MTTNFGEERLTGAFFLDVAKVFDTACVGGLLSKLTVLNFPSYLVQTISSYPHDRTFKTFLQTATSISIGTRDGAAQF
jgi:hypothetical protein